MSICWLMRAEEQAVRFFRESFKQAVKDVFSEHQENHDFNKKIKIESEARKFVT